MLRGLLERLRGTDQEPEEVSLEDLRRLRTGDEDTSLVEAMREKLITTGCAAPRAFYDAPTFASRGRAERLAGANMMAFAADMHCPPYYAMRADATKDLLFLSRAPSRQGAHFAVEVEYAGEGGRVRDLTFHFPGAPDPETIALPPERALELEHVLRQGRFWHLPAHDGRGGLDGVDWYVSRLERGRHHLVHRWQPEGSDLELLESLAAVLDDELAALAERRVGSPGGRARAAYVARLHGEPDELRLPDEATARRCSWTRCTNDQAEGDRSRLCAEHRRRIDAQGENLTRRRRR